jgi:hypothetical protein
MTFSLPQKSSQPVHRINRESTSVYKPGSGNVEYSRTEIQALDSNQTQDATRILRFLRVIGLK